MLMKNRMEMTKKNLHWWMRWERTKGLDLDEKFGKRKILTGGYDLDMIWSGMIEMMERKEVTGCASHLLL
jgi:hypothetical protein